MADFFKYGHSAAAQWRDATQACLAQMGEIPVTANLGFLYVTDVMAVHLQEILSLLKEATGVSHWVGSTGLGICSSGQEYLDQPAIAVMLGEFPEHAFRVFPTIRSLDELQDSVSVGNSAAYFGIVHGDPENQHIPALIEQFANRMESGFVVGGLTSSRNENMQVADGITHGGLSGVVFTSGVALTTRLTQGVSPLGVVHEVTECENSVIVRLDGRPALDVLKEDIGEVLSRDLRRLSNYIFVGLPITGSDTGDYLVRNLVGIDVEQKLLAIGDSVENGRHLLFCRRDGASAVKDMQRMLAEIKSGITGVARGAVYYSCLGRGESLFGAESEELKMISRALGDIPLVGFFANGEISHNRLYGYTGVLTVFL
jgi:small ligand-binding sensory domain FIST